MIKGQQPGQLLQYPGQHIQWKEHPGKQEHGGHDQGKEVSEIIYFGNNAGPDHRNLGENQSVKDKNNRDEQGPRGKNQP